MPRIRLMRSSTSGPPMFEMIHATAKALGTEPMASQRTSPQLTVPRRACTLPPIGFRMNDATTPGIFSGIVMGVTRVGLSGATRWKDLEVGGDVGMNHSTNFHHVSGATNTAFEGRLKVAIEPRWSMSF